MTLPLPLHSLHLRICQLVEKGENIINILDLSLSEHAGEDLGPLKLDSLTVAAWAGLDITVGSGSSAPA